MLLHTARLHTLRAIGFITGLASLLAGGWANADPPSRVARLGYMDGTVSFSPAGDDDWVRATINRPLTTGDRLWAERRARAEIQVGGAMIRIDAGTGVSILNLDDDITQLELTEGTLNVRVVRLERHQVFEVDTPNLALVLRQPGAYRIEVRPDQDETTIILRSGEGEVYGAGTSYVLDSGQAYRFTGDDLRDYDYVDVPRRDAFDRWSSDRDQRYDRSLSAHYVSPDVIGYQDLDTHGTWRVDVTFGNVWFPNRVAAGWAPYRDGHWAWIDPWGWTWMDDAPWGFAVSHYGRWANLHGRWGWVPGPLSTRAYYAPALVAFLSGSNFRVSISTGTVGGIGWFPLGPREVYRPAYPVSRGYFQNVNISNTTINNTVINNYYDNSNVANVVYANRNVQGAVIAVPMTEFVQARQVSMAARQVSREVIGNAPVAFVPPVAPIEQSVRGSTDRRERPPARVFTRKVVARHEPPAAPVDFSVQQRRLEANPGRPLDDAARRQLQPAPAAREAVISNVAPPQAVPPSVPPTTTRDRRSRSAPAAQAPEPAPADRNPRQREPQERRGAQLVAPAPEATSPPAAESIPEARTNDRARRENREEREPREAPVAGTSRRAAQPEAVAPQIAPPPVPVTQSPPPDTAPAATQPQPAAAATDATRKAPPEPPVPASRRRNTKDQDGEKGKPEEAEETDEEAEERNRKERSRDSRN